MTPARFLKTRSIAWDRLEKLIEKTSRSGVRALSDSELHELTRMYPAVAVDVARARLYKIDSNTQQRINHLAIAAHGLLYRKKRTKKIQAIWKFFRYDYPKLFRKCWAYITITIALFSIGFLGAYVSTRLKPSNAYLFVPGTLDITDDAITSSKDISERFRRMSKPPMAAGIITNNISVAFNAFALGITAGVGTCYIVFFNSMMLGGFAGHFANHGLSYALWSFLTPHGFLEIFAILIAGAAGLRFGFSFAMPGGLKRSAALRIGAQEAVMLVLGTVPMFIVAGLIEGFVTPSYLPGIFKIIFGLVVGFTVIWYLLFTARSLKL